MWFCTLIFACSAMLVVTAHYLFFVIMLQSGMERSKPCTIQYSSKLSSLSLSGFIEKTSDKPKSGTLKSPPKGFDTTIISKTYYNVVSILLSSSSASVFKLSLFFYDDQMFLQSQKEEEKLLVLSSASVVYVEDYNLHFECELGLISFRIDFCSFCLWQRLKMHR